MLSPVLVRITADPRPRLLQRQPLKAQPFDVVLSVASAHYLAETGRGNELFARPWVDVGSHRIYFFRITTTITLAFLSSDLLIHYMPINYHPRTGKSKIRPIRDTKNLFLTVIRSILFFNPLRVCLPLGFLLLFLAFIVSFFRDEHGWIYDGSITILVVSALQIIIVGFLADILSRLRR